MKKLIIVSLFILAIIAPGLVFAQDLGPTLSTVTTDILRIVREDGRWYPIYGWRVLNPINKSEVKVAVLDSKGKVMSYAMFMLEKESSDSKGEWYKAKDMTSQWPSKDYEKLQKLQVGNYTMQMISDGQVIWETPFEVDNIIDAAHKDTGSANHFFITGSWRNLVYAYTGSYDEGLVVSFWYQGPRDVNFYDESNAEWIGALRCEVKKDGQLILDMPKTSDANFQLFPWLVRKCTINVGYEKEVQEKMLKHDGDYEVTIFAEAYKYDNWVPIVKFILPIRGGKVNENPELSGNKIDAKHRIITTSAYYTKNLLNDTLPPAKR